MVLLCHIKDDIVSFGAIGIELEVFLLSEAHTVSKADMASLICEKQRIEPHGLESIEVGRRIQ